MANLIEETISVVEGREVLWVGSRDGKYKMTWQDFLALSDVEYDSGYGAQEIAKDLVVVGDTWWLERHEYDGSEWWELKEYPVFRVDALPIKRVKATEGEIGWLTVEEMQ